MSSSAWALALGQVGKGLLEFGQNRETLKYQRERDENLAALQREQLAETTRHSKATEALGVDTLAATKENQEGLLKNDSEKLAIERDAANARASHDSAMLANDNLKTKAIVDESSAKITDLVAVREQDRAKADLTAAEGGFKWDGTAKTYVFDQTLFDKAIQRDEATAKARYSAYSGSKGAWQTEYEIQLDTLRKLKEGGDEKLKDASEGTLQKMALDATNTSQRKTTGTDSFESVDMIRQRVKALDAQIANEFDPQKKAELRSVQDDLMLQWQSALQSQNTGAGLLARPGGARTAAGSEYTSGLGN